MPRLDPSPQLATGLKAGIGRAGSESLERPRQVGGVAGTEAELDRQVAQEVIEVRVAGEDRHRARGRLVDDLVECSPLGLPARRVDDSVELANEGRHVASRYRPLERDAAVQRRAGDALLELAP